MNGFPDEPRPTMKQLLAAQKATDPASSTFGEVRASMTAAGYSRRAVDKEENIKAVERVIIRAMREAGLSEEYLAQKMKEGLNANVVWRTYDKDTKEVVERIDIDYRARAIYLKMLMDARGDFPKEDTVQQAVFIMRIPDKTLTPENWQKTFADPNARAAYFEKQADVVVEAKELK